MMTSMDGKSTQRVRRAPHWILQLAAIGAAVAGWTLLYVGSRAVTTVATCPSSGGGISFTLQNLVFAIPVALFVAGEVTLRRSQVRAARILCGLGTGTALLMTVVAGVSLIGVTMNCGNASSAETAFYVAVPTFLFSALLGFLALVIEGGKQRSG
jgi:hypothetical protein